MDYHPADLKPADVERLQALERDLSGTTGDSIVVVAYKRDAAQGPNTAGASQSVGDAAR